MYKFYKSFAAFGKELEKIYEKVGIDIGYVPYLWIDECSKSGFTK